MIVASAVSIVILTGIALQKSGFCPLHGVIIGHVGARVGFILKLLFYLLLVSAGL